MGPKTRDISSACEVIMPKSKKSDNIAGDQYPTLKDLEELWDPAARPYHEISLYFLERFRVSLFSRTGKGSVLYHCCLSSGDIRDRIRRRFRSSVQFHNGQYAVGSEQELENLLAQQGEKIGDSREPGQPSVGFFDIGSGGGVRNIRSSRTFG